MNVSGKRYRTIWLKEDDSCIVQIIDQRRLPHEFVIEDLASVSDVCRAIEDMYVRGAPLIGATAAFGMYLACLEAVDTGNFDEHVYKAGDKLMKTRPTAVNLAWAVKRLIKEIIEKDTPEEKIDTAKKQAIEIADEEESFSRKIGEYGSELIKKISQKKNGECVNILTHCNAGWLACIDYGTATAPMYIAKEKGIDLHVWVDETRPRNQGASLTAWELGQNNIPHTVIVDNAGGHLMQHGMVDIVIVGSDRTTHTGDVANKIGTYLKALAADDNNIPFYVALTSSAFDWVMKDGLKEIPIETRNEEEVTIMTGLGDDGKICSVRITPEGSPAINYGFDVTPARLVTGLITERGVCNATQDGIAEIFPDMTV